MEKLDKKDWILWGRWVQPVLSGGFWSRWCEASSIKEILPNFNPTPILFLDGHTFFAAKDVEACQNIVVQLYENGGLNDLYDRVEKVSKAHEERILALPKKNDLDTVAYVEELFTAYTEMVGVWVIVVHISNQLESLVLKTGLAVSEEDMVRKLSYYWRPTWLERQNLEIKSLVRDLMEKEPATSASLVDEALIEKHPEIEMKLQKHIEEFDWFGTHHWVGDPYTLEKALADMKSVLEKGDYAEKKEEKNTEDDPANETMWKLLAACMYWRTHAAEVTAKAVYHSRGLLENLARNWGMSYDQLTWLSSREVLESARANLNSITLPENFTQRAHGYGCNIDLRGNETITVGDELHELVRQVVPVIESDVKELRGTVASRGGLVIGKVTVVISPNDISKFREGDILVVPETTPDFVPIMKLARAIITEVGGITSHAAIVSRELGKPCITGTKIATRVLKDGDMVEVDAEKGIVRILEN